VPWWAANAGGAARRINARVETVAARPAYRSALAARRCLLPADGYYEWATGPNGRRQPYFLRPPAGSGLAFAGLYERWREPTGQLRWTATILTAAASGPLAVLHDRMPMVVPEPDWEAWLDPDLTNAHEALSLPMSPGELLTAYPVHPRVGSVLESGSGLIAPVEAAQPSSALL